MLLAAAALTVLVAGMALFTYRWMRHAGRNVALVLRLENPDVIRNLLGVAAMTELVAELARRLSAELNTRARVQVTGAGEFCAMLGRMTKTETLRQSDIIHAICAQGIKTSGGWVRPTVAGVLVRATSGAEETSDLHDFGRQVLRGFGPGSVGRIIIMGYGAIPFVERTELVPLFSSEWLEIRYRPRLCANTGAILAVEAEATLNHPKQGRLMQVDFLSRLEPSVQLDVAREMIRHALTALRDWDAAGARIECLTLRIAESQLAASEFPELCLWELDRQDIVPSRLGLALIETQAAIMPSADARRSLERLAGAGCRVEVDEQGFGGTLLEDNSRIGAAAIRIGPGFVRDCDRLGEKQRMILAFLALAEHLDLTTIAIDVDTPAEMSFLTQIGVGWLQGSAVAGLLSQDEVARHILKHGRPLRIELPLRSAG